MYVFYIKSFFKIYTIQFRISSQKKMKNLISEFRHWLHWGMCLVGYDYLCEAGRKIPLVFDYSSS